MSTSSSSLSAGLQAIVNDGLLPSNLTAKQLQNASPGQLTQIAIDNVESADMSSLFGASASASDTVSLSGNLSASPFGQSSGSNTSTADSVLEALETNLAISSTSAAASGTSGSSTALSSGNPASDTIGTLFSYLG